MTFEVTYFNHNNINYMYEPSTYLLNTIYFPQSTCLLILSTKKKKSFNHVCHVRINFIYVRDTKRFSQLYNLLHLCITHSIPNYNPY